MTMLRWGFVLITRLMEGGLLAMNTLSIARLSTSQPTSSFTLPRPSGRGFFVIEKGTSEMDVNGGPCDFYLLTSPGQSDQEPRPTCM